MLSEFSPDFLTVISGEHFLDSSRDLGFETRVLGQDVSGQIVLGQGYWDSVFGKVFCVFQRVFSGVFSGK